MNSAFYNTALDRGFIQANGTVPNMALETEADEPLSDEEAVLEERAEMLEDEENLVEAEEFLDDR